MWNIIVGNVIEK